MAPCPNSPPGSHRATCGHLKGVKSRHDVLSTQQTSFVRAVHIEQIDQESNRPCTTQSRNENSSSLHVYRLAFRFTPKGRKESLLCIPVFFEPFKSVQYPFALGSELRIEIGIGLNRSQQIAKWYELVQHPQLSIDA